MSLLTDLVEIFLKNMDNKRTKLYHHELELVKGICKLSFMNWIPKKHKNPFGNRIFYTLPGVA